MNLSVGQPRYSIHKVHSGIYKSMPCPAYPMQVFAHCWQQIKIHANFLSPPILVETRIRDSNA